MIKCFIVLREKGVYFICCLFNTKRPSFIIWRSNNKKPRYENEKKPSLLPLYRLFELRAHLYLHILRWRHNENTYVRTAWYFLRNSPRFVRLRPDNNSLLNIRHWFLHNRRNLWNSMKKSARQQAGKNPRNSTGSI